MCANFLQKKWFEEGVVSGVKYSCVLQTTEGTVCQHHCVVTAKLCKHLQILHIPLADYHSTDVKHVEETHCKLTMFIKVPLKMKRQEKNVAYWTYSKETEQNNRLLTWVAH